MSKPRKVRSKPDDIDKRAGKNLRLYRMMAGLSQETLAGAVDVTFQQIQKYELGSNRMSASRILSFAKLLNVEVSDFYNGLEEGLNKETNLLDKFYSLDQESIDFISLYTQITDKKKRQLLLNVLKNIQEKNIN